MKKNWEMKKLGEVIKLEYGKPLPDSKRKSDGAYSVYGANGVKDRTDEYYYDKPSIIVGRKGSAGEINLTEKRFWPLDVTYFVVFDNKKYDLNFIYHLLSKLELPRFAKGVKPGINRNEVCSMKVQIPSLPEQQHIIAILDEAFAAIAKAKTNAEQNLKNAKELFGNYLQGVFENKGEGWEEKTLMEVLSKTETVEPSKKPNEEFIYLDVSSVNKETKEIENANVLLGKNAPSRARKMVITNDVIFATVRPTHGRVALITEEYDKQVCSTGYFVLRAKEFLSNKLVYYFLLTFGFNKKMERLQKGASYPAVTDNEVKSIFIPFPKSLKTQQAIVQKLDALSFHYQR